MTTKIYIDTEFTDLLDMDLISIALVCGEDRFYAERSDYDDSLCAAFTREAVLTQLGSVAAMTWDEMRQAVRTWLQRYEDREPVLCYDNIIDFAHLRELLDGSPPWLRTQNIKDAMDPHSLLAYFREHGIKPHHALNDALANQHTHTVARQANGLN